MKTIFNWLGLDWKRVKNHCRTTVNKEFTDIEPSEDFKRKLIISEHSPIRLLEIDWSWKDIPSWVSVHWTRHKHEKFVSTQRDDRKDHTVSRSDMPQGTPVDMDNYANAQQLIDIFRKRLCYQASPETRELAEDFKMALHKECPELSDALVPNCVYRCGCPEFQECGYFRRFSKWANEQGEPRPSPLRIQGRYDLYNEFFWEEKSQEHGRKMKQEIDEAIWEEMEAKYR